MKTVTIFDRDPSSGVLSFDLRDILAVLGDDVQRSTWAVQDVECIGGDAAAALHHASDAHEVLEGDRLSNLARDVGQIIDGEFSAYLPGEDAAWVRIRAVDSSAFEVETDRADILAMLAVRFSGVVVS